MKIGISLPNNWGVEDVNELLEIAVSAEKLGYHSIWTSEHLINVSYVRSRIGDGPYYSPLSILSAVAVKTSRIQLGTSVIVLPFHSPFFLAKYFATLDHLSRGRAILGVGIGNVPEEFTAVGVPWEKRGALTDEAIDIISALWSQDSAAHQGKVWQFSDVHTSPKPYQKTIPIWIGGTSQAALRRVVRVGHGWQPAGITSQEFRELGDQIRTQALASGRKAEEIEACMRVNVAFEGEGFMESELTAMVNPADAAAVAKIADEFREAGASHFIFALNCRNPDRVKRAIEEMAEALGNHLGG